MLAGHPVSAYISQMYLVPFPSVRPVDPPGMALRSPELVLVHLFICLFFH